MSQLDAFEEAARVAVLDWHERHRGKHWREIQRLVPLAQELAIKAGVHGVTVGDVRLVAEQRGLLERGSGRRLSWLCQVPKAAGLHPTGKRRLCPQPGTRNDQVVYVLRGSA